MAGGSSVLPQVPQLVMNPMEVDIGDLNMAMEDPDSQVFQSAPPPSVQQDTIPLSNVSLANMGNNSLSGIGAGPLPTGFGMQNPNTTGSTLTEFTKRRNWSKLVLEELRDLMMIMSPDGRVQHVSPSCKLLTGYDPFHLVGKFAAEYVHQDDKAMFIREFNESIASGNQMRFFYRFRRPDNIFTIFEAFGHPHLTSDAVTFGTGGARYCRGFFMMSRPYPTKNAALLDSFLEHKIENERLTKRIAELKREEQEEEEEQESMWRREGQGTMTPSESMRTDGRDSGSGAMSSSEAMPPPARPSTSNTALTRQNLDEALASARPDSISDKMARYEGATHIETIEMLTGLRYRDGERSQGISTGAPSPALIRGDAGIAIFADRDSRTNIDRKKKTKVADEYVCTDCGTLDSPEWRKGPNGPKTLCNACGLRWAKKEKKRQQAGKPASLPKQASTSS